MFFTLGKVNVSYAWVMPSVGLQALLYNCLHRKWLNSDPCLISYFFLSTFWSKKTKPCSPSLGHTESLAVAALQNFLTERCVHFLPPCFINFGGGLLVWVCFLLKFLLRQSPPWEMFLMWKRCQQTAGAEHLFPAVRKHVWKCSCWGRTGLVVPFAVVGPWSCQKPSQTALRSPGCWCSPATQCCCFILCVGKGK